jgi:hypothetical protein
VQTAEIVRPHEPAELAEPSAPAEPEEPAEPMPAGRRRGVLGTATSVFCVLGATLAFGLIGLFISAWRVRRARSAGPNTPAGCPDCRRRRHRAVVGVTALVGLVIAGTAMSVHQQVSGPALPSCVRELPSPETDDAGDPFAQLAGGMWKHTRRALTAPVTGLTRHFLGGSGGGMCDGGSMTLASMPAGASGSSVAVGSIVLTESGSSLRTGASKKLARHESRHVSQWAAFTLVGGPAAMPALYVVDDAFFPESRNHFERAAGLWAGGYERPESFGPRVDWSKAGLLGLIAWGLSWRRVRWGSRVLIDGAAAGRAQQGEHCPVHSRGWFRLRARA